MFKLPQNKKQSQPWFRKTIKNNGFVEGVGLHSGENIKLTFHPAEENTGICFYNGKFSGVERCLPVNLEHVIDTSMAVTLGKDRFYIQTIEHLMFAIHLLQITDMIIEIRGGHEIPILDGSASLFIEALNGCEFHTFPSEVDPLVISEPIMVSDGNRYLVGIPSPVRKISYHIDYPHPMLKNRSCELVFNEEFFINYIGRARTIGFLKDVEKLREKGLAQGGSVENVLVFTNEGTLNEPRFTHEPLYHKVLDMVGDLAILGRPIIGHLLGSKGGHALDIAFAKKIIQQFGSADNEENPLKAKTLAS